MCEGMTILWFMVGRLGVTEDEQFQQRLGQRIRYLREKKGWTQDTLAHLAGLHRAYPYRIENGLVDLRVSTLRKLSTVFEIPLRELIDC